MKSELSELSSQIISYPVHLAIWGSLYLVTSTVVFLAGAGLWFCLTFRRRP
jgi:hypothetical protein